jgi:peptidoglycan/LPS O-acetylase OafA/YrhL
MITSQSSLTNADSPLVASYRPEIDGLRAIAVTSVVIFHAFPNFFPGGYLGVDIFFVISGYLVTGTILRDTKDNRFDISEFYVRRIRRILPALIATLCCVLISGWYLLRLSDFNQLVKHVLAGASFSSNLLLQSESGYFDKSSELKPLLHLWSLAIEEQFYVVFPLFLAVALRFLKSLKSIQFVLLAIMIASFVFSIQQRYADSAGSFYSPFSRIWELLAGSVFAILARNQNTRMPTGKRRHEDSRTMLIGVGMILGSMLSIDLDLFPEIILTVISLSGACLILSIRSESQTGFLSNQILVFIGKMSFSLYLIHWPLLSFARISAGQPTSIATRLTLVCLAILLSIGSYFLIEKPFRGSKSQKPLAFFVSLGLLFVVGVSAFINLHEILPYKSSSKEESYLYGDLDHQEFHGYVTKNFHLCTPKSILETSLSWDGFLRCNQSKAESPIEVLLLGDSHAEHLFVGIAESLPSQNVGYYIRDSSLRLDNPEFSLILQEVVKNQSIKQVIISERWDQRGFDVDEIGAIVEVLQSAGKDIFITDGVPNFSFDPQLCKYDGLCTESRSRFDSQYSNYLPGIIELTKRYPSVGLIYTTAYFCDVSSCSMTNGSELLYRDDNHLNIYGSRYAGMQILKSGILNLTD